MDDVFVYHIKLPPGIEEVVMPCLDGYTVYIDINLDHDHRVKAYEHALWHIQNHDFERPDVQDIESEAHNRAKYFEFLQ